MAGMGWGGETLEGCRTTTYSKGGGHILFLTPYLTTKLSPQQVKRSALIAETEDLTQVVLGLDGSSSEGLLCSVCPSVNVPQCHIRGNTSLGKTNHIVSAFYLGKPLCIGLTQYIKL